MGDRTKIAVVGTGHFGRHHVRILSGHEDADLVAICDQNEERAGPLSEEYGVPLVADTADLPDDLEAVVVAVPTVAHLTVAEPFLRRGVAALVEKPLAKDLAEAEALCAAAEEGGAILATGHVERFNPALTIATKNEITPGFIECSRVAPFSFRSADVGVVLDLMIHDLDIVLALVHSDLKRVHACGAPVITQNEDIANARIEFESGCVANITASRVAAKAERKVRIFSTDAYMSLDFGKKTGSLFKKTDKLTPEHVQELIERRDEYPDLRTLVFGNLITMETFSMDERDPLTDELTDFLRAVREGGQPKVTGRDGYRAVAAALRVLEAIGQQPVLR